MTEKQEKEEGSSADYEVGYGADLRSKRASAKGSRATRVVDAPAAKPCRKRSAWRCAPRL